MGKLQNRSVFNTRGPDYFHPPVVFSRLTTGADITGVKRSPATDVSLIRLSDK